MTDELRERAETTIEYILGPSPIEDETDAEEMTRLRRWRGAVDDAEQALRAVAREAVRPHCACLFMGASGSEQMNQMCVFHSRMLRDAKSEARREALEEARTARPITTPSDKWDYAPYSAGVRDKDRAIEALAEPAGEGES